MIEDTAETYERIAEPVSRQADILTRSPSTEESVSASSGAKETVQENGPSSSNSLMYIVYISSNLFVVFQTGFLFIVLAICL